MNAKDEAQVKLVRDWMENPDLIIYIDKCDGTGEWEPAKVLRFVAITEPLEHPLYVHGIDNNQVTVDVEIGDIRRKAPGLHRNGPRRRPNRKKVIG